MDRSKKMVVGGVAAVVVVVVIVLLAWPKASPCTPSKDKPDVKALQSKNVVTKEATTLANFVGYMEFPAEKTYLPLDIDSISVGKADDQGVQTVTMSGQCVTVGMKYKEVKPTPDGKTSASYQLSELELEVKDGSSKTTKYEFDHSFFANVPASERYSCKKEQSHQCASKPEKKDDKSEPASLVLTSFELELGSDPTKAAKGDFHKAALPGSCDMWKN